MAGHRSSMRPRIAALSLLHRPFLSDRVLRPLKCLKYAGVPQAAFCHAGRTDCERVGGKVSHGESPDSGRLGSISVYPGPSRGGRGLRDGGTPGFSSCWAPAESAPQQSSGTRIGEKRDGDAKRMPCHTPRFQAADIQALKRSI